MTELAPQAWLALHSLAYPADPDLSADGPRWLPEAFDRRAAAKTDARTPDVDDAETRYRTFLESVPALLYMDIYDTGASPGYRSGFMSRHVEAVLGYPSEALQADDDLWPSLIHPDDRAETLAREARHFMTGAPLHQEFRMITRDGRTIWFQDAASIVRGDDGTVYSVGVLTDVSERKRLEEQLTHDALHDPLTGLANRLLFADRIDRALLSAARAGGQPGVLFLDLDRFKAVNDSLGHATGDRLLVAVAHRLTDAVRAADSVARLGGDEFGVLLDGLSGPEEAIMVAGRISTALEPPIELDGRAIPVRVSIGIALAGPHASEASALLRNADAAMYRAKEAGRGGWTIFEPAIHAAAIARLELESDLRAAVEARAFSLEYQPIVRLDGEAVVSYEALLRWERPGHGSVSPAEFIPIAEESGLIVPLGRLVLEVACREAASWQTNSIAAAGPSLSVNVSARQLADAHFIDDLVGALSQAELDPGRLVVEITEGAVMADLDRAVAVLVAVRALGVRVALDDFGTGFSSLSHLRRLPIDILKIDRSFVAEVDRAGTEAVAVEAAVVEAVLGLARALGIETVAEGVERPEQVAVLRSLGCRYGQGYLFGRPESADELARIHPTGDRRSRPRAGNRTGTVLRSRSFRARQLGQPV